MYPEEFLCWVGVSHNYYLWAGTYPQYLGADGAVMDMSTFIRAADPRKVKLREVPLGENQIDIVERAKHRTVPLLAVAEERTPAELSVSVEREFDGVAFGGAAETSAVVPEPVAAGVAPAAEHVAEPLVEARVDAVGSPPRGRRKRKAVVTDSTLRPKKLRDDYVAASGAGAGDARHVVTASGTGGKSLGVVNRLLRGSTQNLVVRQAEFVASSVSDTPPHEGSDHHDLIFGAQVQSPPASSHKPNAAKLSKTLIAILSIGGVPKNFFLKLLKETLEDAQRVCLDPRAAFRVANIYQHIDDSGICLEMLGARIPLSEPFLQHRLSQLAKEERKGLGEGKIPISDSFYLIGTTDPTGILNSDEVCVVYENGQISGKVLVYRNPGLHFGDVDVLNARYVKELEDYIGNSKFGIFFSTKGRRSVANEIAGGDFDGDIYWVSKNHELLRHFKPSEPWTHSYSTPNAISKKPSDMSYDELEHELRRRLFSSETNSSSAGIAADSCMAYTDQHLILQDDDTTDEKDVFVKKILKLIDLYYDALDASKSGKKVIPNDLKATQYPHYMDRKPVYRSTSIIGQIYDAFQSCKNEKLPVQEIWNLHYFNISNVPNSCLSLWKERYETYKQDMSNALRYNDISKNDAASSVIKKYKQILCGASDFKDTTRNIEHVYNEALAIYHVSYEYARKRNDIAKCGFAWKVAGSALCAYYRKIHCMNTGDREITFVSSAFDGVF